MASSFGANHQTMMHVYINVCIKMMTYLSEVVQFVADVICFTDSV